MQEALQVVLENLFGRQDTNFVRLQSGVRAVGLQEVIQLVYKDGDTICKRVCRHPRIPRG